MAAEMTRKPSARASSGERREQVIRAAVREFAQHGYHAASTGAIAKRAGISQPYIYALFPNKHELFVATVAHVVGHIRDAFTDAARGLADPEERLEAMGGPTSSCSRNATRSSSRCSRTPPRRATRRCGIPRAGSSSA